MDDDAQPHHPIPTRMTAPIDQSSLTTTDLAQPGVALGQELRAAEGEVLLDDLLEGRRRAVYVCACV